MSHWAARYLGTPWENHSNDCYALVRRIYREHFAIEMPVVDVNALSTLAVARAAAAFDRSAWREVATPADGDVVQMGCARRPHHVGVWIDVDGGRILHSTEGAGVIAQSRAQARANGWQILNIYRHQTRCSPL